MLAISAPRSESASFNVAVQKQIALLLRTQDIIKNMYVSKNLESNFQDANFRLFAISEVSGERSPIVGDSADEKRGQKCAAYEMHAWSHVCNAGEITYFHRH